MRLLLLLFLSLLYSTLSLAQENVVVLSTDMFQSHQRLYLATLDGWKFHQGNDPNWARPDVDVSEWQSLNPTEISNEMEDESGRIEGWFHLTFVLDDSFHDIPIAISRDLWAATDLYINGELYHSFGNTGNPYSAYNPVLKYPTPINLQVGEAYSLAIHFVDYQTTFTQRELQLKPQNLTRFINLTGPEYLQRVTDDIRSAHVYGTLSMSISFLLFILFWFLAFLNPEQKIFKWIAWMSTVILLSGLASFYHYFYELNYDEEKLRFFFLILLLPISTLSCLFILEYALLSKITRTSLLIAVSVFIANPFAHYFSISLPFGIFYMMMVGYFVYLVYSNWNQISGAKWSIVASMIFPVIATTVYIVIHKYSIDVYNEYDKMFNALITLGAPLFLLAYVSVRFREILDDVTSESEKVLHVTEEKKELLFNQNVILEKQVEDRTKELKQSLADLKATQSQLIQQEKLASLGQLTAGIAHEIKNPLNFVNNFSELSVELVEQTKEELLGVSENVSEEDREKISEALTILEDIKSNVSKIHIHGTRADSIVKAMLQHSRTSDGKKESTDLNALVKEYVNLSFHGMRAGKNPINVDLEFDLDESIREVPLIAEDFSRVIVNLANNAFDACSEKLSAIGDRRSAIGGQPLVDGDAKKDAYAPKVRITTKLIANSGHPELVGGQQPTANSRWLIAIEDNGHGIPDSIKDKIFQPFFTTKKGTEGTGLGLSLSYDIIKAHGGELTVTSIPNEKTVFSLKIPQ